MFERFRTGLKIGIDGFKFLFKYPKSLFSVLVCWITLGLIFLLIYGIAKLTLNIDSLAGTSIIVIVILIAVSFSLSTSVASLVLLEFIKQHENKQLMSIKKALRDTIKKDLLKATPIIVVWSSTIFFIRIFQFIFAVITYPIISIFDPRSGFGSTRSSSVFGFIIRGVRVFMIYDVVLVYW